MSARDRLRSLLPDEEPIPSLAEIDRVCLPEVASLVELAEEKIVRADSVFDNSDKLDKLTDLALDKLEEIIELPCAGDDTKLIAIQKDAAVAVVNLTNKVDDSRLKRRQQDILPKLLEAMERAQKTLPKVIDAQVIL